METSKFKTYINCGGCVANVTTFLNEEKSIQNWQVDTSNHNKILFVAGNAVNGEEVVKAVEKAGFSIEPLP